MKKSYTYHLQFIILTSLLLPSLLWAESVQSFKDFSSKPQLVVTIVIDQFRADYLTRFEKKFLKAKLPNGKLGGFQFLVENSAYFPFAQYDVYQNMTCPGHAMISTGARPYVNGIVLNEFYDRELKRMSYCAEDSQYGFSPRKLKSTTVSDEYKNAGNPSQVYAVALKDRSAIMLGGHRADMAIWMDYKKFEWQTSGYYSKQSPQWLKAYNDVMSKRNKEITIDGQKVLTFSKTGLSYAAGIDETLKLAEEIMHLQKLGQTPKQTDFLYISLSTHDMLGHKMGLNSKELEELTLHEDQRLSEFFNFVQSKIKNLDQVQIYLTADHGVAPTVDYSTQAKLDAGKIDYLELFKKINSALDKKYGEAKNKSWIIASKSLHLYFDQDLLKDKKVNLEEASLEAQKAISGLTGVYKVLTRSELLEGKFPVGVLGEQVKRQFSPELSGDLIVIPEPFYMDKDENTTTHMTGYSYDRTVPLILFGAKYKKGVYSSEALVIDLASTMSFSLGVIPPALSEGKVLPVFK